MIASQCKYSTVDYHHRAMIGTIPLASGLVSHRNLSEAQHPHHYSSILGGINVDSTTPDLLNGSTHPLFAPSDFAIRAARSIYDPVILDIAK
jgi:hypothetical protein